jgi:hypothetical protein
MEEKWADIGTRRTSEGERATEAVRVEFACTRVAQSAVASARAPSRVKARLHQIRVGLPKAEHLLWTCYVCGKATVCLEIPGDNR